MKYLCPICIFLFFGMNSIVWAGDSIPPELLKEAETELQQLGHDPVVVAAVQAENAKGKTLAQIKAADQTWQATAGLSAEMKAPMESTCGKYLHGIQADKGYYAEIFVMDIQGANVAMTDKTSDYWQGDEAKFIESYMQGRGKVHVGAIEFDDSTQSYLAQISVPVMDGDHAIGVVTIGVDMDAFEIHLAERR